jgi:hypothetical protein
MRLPTEIIRFRQVTQDLERKVADVGVLAQRLAPTVADARSVHWARAVAQALRSLPVGASDAVIVERAKAVLREHS